MKDFLRENFDNRSNKTSFIENHFLSLHPREIWCLLQKKTRFGSTCSDCLRTSLDKTDGRYGLYAVDGDCFDTFRSLFWPFIIEYHQIDLRNLTFVHDFGDFRQIQEFTPEMKDRIVSIEIQVHRTLENFPMIPKLTDQQLIEIENRVQNGLCRMEEEFLGDYHSLQDMDETTRFYFERNFVELPDMDDSLLTSIGIYNHWPTGRGVHINKDRSFSVWINRNDHLVVMLRSINSDLSQTYARFVRGLTQISQTLEFQKHKTLGYLTFSPLNVGTAMNINIRIRLNSLKNVESVKALVKDFHVSIKTSPDSSVFDVSNLTKLEKSEFQLVRGMWACVQRIIEHDMK